ncbi:MAG TPA: hypothetical protein DDY78_05765 [Planctomycetales bacterium]|jgi:hypothetical protein|nr:hypothetical protein [Planctomycetales bacterium]
MTENILILSLKAQNEALCHSRNAVILSRKAQTEGLSRALDCLGPTIEDSDALSQEEQWLIEDCVRSSGRLKAAFDRGQRRWTARPIEDIHEFYTEFLGIVDHQLQLAGRVRDRALKASETSLDAFDLKPLDESIQALIQLREAVVALCEWLISPFPAPAWDEPRQSAEERRAEFERGEYEYVEDVLNRVLQGGPLVKE